MTDWTDKLSEAARVLRGSRGGKRRVSRFAKLERKLAARGAHDPQALAAWIERKKLGQAELTRRAEAGRRRAERRGGKRRFNPEQLKEGAAEELHEHGKTLAKLRAGKLTVKQAAAQTAKDHLKLLPDYYSRMDALEVPKPKKGLKSPRIKLLMKRGRVRVYLVASHLVRKMKDQGDWANGGHSTVFPATIPKNEVWIGDETFGPERKLYILHELLEFWRMNHGMSYDEAHDLSTEAEQKFRRGKMRGIDAAVRDALKKAAASR